MEGLVVDTGKTLVEKLINNAIKKSRYIVCFRCISKEFDEEKIKLEAEMTTMKQRFKVATNKGKEIKKNADLWEKQADKLIQDDTKTKPRCFFGFCPDCTGRYKRGRDLTTKIVEIKKMIEKGEKLENVELARSLPDVERYSSQYYISFESREMKIKELLDALKDGSNYITGLYGMGGTGKTTLAKEVGKQLKTLEQFDHVIDTTVSFTPDIKKIQNDIAGSLGLEWGDINESDRPKMLWRRLTNGEKILVILDDVWGNLNFDEIGIPNSDNHNGCKVLVTTRNLWVCNKMICGMTIKLELLSEEDAWLMFKMHAHLNNDSSKSFHEKGYKITTECKRLPVAIATIASSLKGQKRLEEWDYALKSLQKHVSMVDVDDDLVGIYKCLKFSYDYLKNEKAKRLFLLCSVFPEDEEISVEILTRLSKGVGLFGDDYGSYEDARSQIVVAKNKLIYSCLLLETQGGEVKMHDLVREVAQWMANREIQTVSLYNKNQKSLVERDKNIKYLLCEGNLRDFFSSMFDGSKLEILIFIMDMCESVDVPISFFENIPGLRVLSLSNKSPYWPTIERTSLSLSQSIRSLMNIRSLLVKNINLGDISILGSLESLETLDLNRCYIDELPHEIIKLEKFQLLNLDGCKIKRNNPFEVIQRCSSLEELYFCNSFNDSCQKITLPTLQRYCLTDDFCGLINNSLSKYVSLQQNYFSESTFKYVMQTTELLQLERVEKGWRNIMPEIVPIDQGMNDIIEFHLSYDSELQCLVDTKQHIDSQVPNVFSKLVVLELYQIKKLEELCNGPISFDSMSHLQELTIEYCGNLRSLFQGNRNLSNLKTVKLRSCSTLVSVFDLPTSQSLLLLEKLEIIDCEQLENIFTHDGKNTSCNSMFPKLKVVNIELCPKLQFIFSLISTEGLLLLETVKIKCCNMLKYIFGQYQNVELASLNDLLLEMVISFIGIFPESCNSIEGSSNSISKPYTHLQEKLKPIKSNIFSLSHMCCFTNKMRGTDSTKIPLASEDQSEDCSPLASEDQSEDCPISMVPNSNCFTTSISHIICNIKVIKLAYISKINSVFMLSINIAPKMSLESLTIDSCHDLEHIIVVDVGDGSDRNELGNVFSKLIELHVKNCRNLIYIFGDDNQTYNNEVIQLHLPALKCLKFRDLPSFIGMSTKHYRTTFPSLLEVGLCMDDTYKSIGDLIVPNYSMTSISHEISTTIKEMSVTSILALEILKIKNSNVQNIFCLNVANEQQVNLGFQHIELKDLPIMTSFFVSPRNCFSLQYLRRLKIQRCEKLKIIFSMSIIRCLPQLYHLRIEKCKELKHIFEDDTENKQMSNVVSSKTCFPKLRALIVIECNKLKSVLPVSICNELPKTKALMIKQANEIQEVSGTEGDQKDEIPNLEFVAFINLPSLFHVQGIQFQAIPNRFVQNCQNVSLTSTLSTDNVHNLIKSLDNASGMELEDRPPFTHFRKSSQDYYFTPDSWSRIFRMLQETTKDFVAEIEVQATSVHKLTSSQELLDEPSTSYLGDIDTAVEHPQDIKISVEDVDLGDSQETTQTNNQASGLYLHMESVYQQFQEESKVQNNGNENPSAQTTKEFTALIQAEAASRHELTSSQIKLNQTLEVKHEFVENVPALEIPPAAILPTNLEELMSEHSIDEHCLMNPQESVGEIITNVKHPQLINLEVSTSEKSAAATLSTISGTENELPIQLFSPKQKSVEITFKEETISANAKTISSSTHLELVDSSSSPLVTSISQEDGADQIATTSFSIATTKTNDHGDPSQKVEDLSSSLLVTRELEQLVSKNHLDYENFSLLNEFLIKHSFVSLKDTSLSNLYKGYAYKSLVDLLKFLKTHSVLEVLGSCQTEFEELLQNARSFGFDKNWLDGVERRALFREIPKSQDPLQKLLDSKEQVIKDVEALRMNIDISNQHVEKLKHQLTSSEMLLASIIQQEALLSSPIGY